jgi:bacteriochlorophyll 4-vinyl reductase
MSVQISEKSESDPVCDMHITDAYMRWALEAAEEVAGKNGLGVVLREAGLGHLIDNYPQAKLAVSGTISYAEYANLNAGLLNFFGRAAKSMTIRIGRISTRRAIDQQSALFGIAALMAAKLLPLSMQLKMLFDAQISGFQKLSKSVGEEYVAHAEDCGDYFIFSIQTCAMCAGKTASQPICHLYTGTLQESIKWLTGKDMDIQETECRALGAPTCVWQIYKTSRESYG